MNPDCPSAGQSICYTCQLPGHISKDCFRGKRAAEMQEWRLLSKRDWRSNNSRLPEELVLEGTEPSTVPEKLDEVKAAEAVAEAVDSWSTRPCFGGC